MPVAKDTAGNLSLVMVEGRTFVHNAILDDECRKRDREIERLRGLLDADAKTVQALFEAHANTMAHLRAKDTAMAVLFDRMRAAGVDYSDLIP